MKNSPSFSFSHERFDENCVSTDVERGHTLVWSLSYHYNTRKDEVNVLESGRKVHESRETRTTQNLRSPLLVSHRLFRRSALKHVRPREAVWQSQVFAGMSLQNAIYGTRGQETWWSLGWLRVAGWACRCSDPATLARNGEGVGVDPWCSRRIRSSLLIHLEAPTVVCKLIVVIVVL